MIFFLLFNSEVSLTSYEFREGIQLFCAVLNLRRPLGTSKLPFSWKWNYVASCCLWHIISLEGSLRSNQETSALSQSWWCCLRWRQAATLPLSWPTQCNAELDPVPWGLLHNWRDCSLIGPWSESPREAELTVPWFCDLHVVTLRGVISACPAPTSGIGLLAVNSVLLPQMAREITELPELVLSS